MPSGPAQRRAFFRERRAMDVDNLPNGFPVPDVSHRLQCSACGSRNVKTRPNWKQREWHRKHVR
jgi:hypothetical protein